MQAPYSRFKEIKSNFRIKNKESNVLGGNFGNRDNVRAPILYMKTYLGTPSPHFLEIIIPYYPTSSSQPERGSEKYLMKVLANSHR